MSSTSLTDPTLLTKFSRQPLVISASAHLIFVVLFLLTYGFQEKKILTKNVEFTVIQQEPKALTRPIDDKPVAPPVAKKIEALKPKAVFGLNRNALTTSQESTESAVTLKQGNTVAKEQDQEKLMEDDPSSLPNPTDEFLVTSMPVLISEVRIPYPKPARDAGIEGPVVMELLIDAEGKVRNVTLISGPGYGLNEAAMEAVHGIKFKPAKIDQQAVAVKIRYTYRFVLGGKTYKAVF